MKRLISNLLFFILLTGKGQDIPTGTWRNHFNYSDSRKIISANQKLFCASEFGLYYLDLNQMDLRTIEKRHGLSDVGIGAMVFDASRDMLALGYGSGTIDFVYTTHVQTIRTLSEADIISGKQIFDFELFEGRLYAATDLGIALIDLNSEEVRDIYHEIGPGGTPVSTTALIIYLDTLYTMSNYGIMSAHIRDNLLDFNNWFIHPNSITLQGKDFFPLDGSLQLMTNTLATYQYADGGWIESIDLPEPLNDVVEGGDRTYGITDHLILDISQGDATIVAQDIFSKGNELAYVDGGLWAVDGEKGLLRLDGVVNSSFYPPGPLEATITRMRVIDDELLAFYAPNQDQQGNSLDSLGFSRFSGHWINDLIPGLYSISGAANYRGDLYLSSFGSGLYHYQSQQIIEPTEALQISDLLTMNDQLWLTSYDDSAPLRAWNGEGDWQEYSINQTGTRFPVSLARSIGDVLWIERGKDDGLGLVAYEPVEDAFRLITTADGLPSNNASVRIDLEDEAWIATSNGLVVFPDATFIFTNESAFTPYFDGFPLFEDQTINTIAFDAGNRRWIGTGQGLYLFDALLTENIHHFTTKNSELPSNQIQELEYNSKTGELFILTDKGLTSYQTDSSEPQPKHKNVRIYPNPVRANYDGVLTISGLVANATVKITSIEGLLMQEFKANGSTLSWDLHRFNGQTIGPGVYLVFSSSFDGEETYVGKFAVLR